MFTDTKPEEFRDKERWKGNDAAIGSNLPSACRSKMAGHTPDQMDACLSWH